MSSATIIEDGQASLRPSSPNETVGVPSASADEGGTQSASADEGGTQSASVDDGVTPSASEDVEFGTHSDSEDDDLEVILGPPAPPAQQTIASQVTQPAVVWPVVVWPIVNVRYTQVPTAPMQLDPYSTHQSPWYTVVAGKFIGVFEDTGAADKATRKVSCSSHKAFTSQQAAVNAFNVAQAIGDLEVIA